MYFAKQDFFFGDRQFKEGDVVPDNIASNRLKDLGVVGFKDEPEPKVETVKPKKKSKQDQILVDESSKVEVSKEI